jgi:lipoprotein-releasing system ATP-binding protein
MSEPALELKGITRRFQVGSAPPILVLQGLDLTVRAGETVALVAPSGAGKSTLLHIAGLLDQPDEGEVVIGGRVMTGQPDAVRTAVRRDEVGFVYQFHHLLPEFSACENVVLPQLANGVAAGLARARATELLSWLGLADRLDHRPAELSGGQQQRVAVGRALANAPRLLLADEPTGNLDEATAEQVFALLLGVARQTGLAALIATHNPALAARMDRTVHLSGGRIA